MSRTYSPVFLSREGLLAELRSNVTLITGNQRLARSILHSVDENAVAAGKYAWETPAIISWNGWLENFFENSLDQASFKRLPQVLSELQEQHIWEQVISNDSDNPLLQIAATARQAAASWRLINEWQLDLDSCQQLMSEDSRVFQQWSSKFKAQCEQQSLISRSELPALLVKMIQGNSLSIESRIILTGFDELTPVQISILDACKKHCCQIDWYESKPIDSEKACVCFEDERKQITTIARWARNLLELEPQCSIGIIVPDLARQRNIIQGLFDKVFAAHMIAPENIREQRIYNISMGQSLARFSQIQTAFLLLNINNKVLPVEDWSVIILSVYIGSWEQEKNARAYLDRKLRELGVMEASIGLIQKLALTEDTPHYCPKLAGQLQAFRQYNDDADKYKQSSAWSKHFSDLLTALGYMQGRSVDSDEFQLAERWKQLLCEFSMLDNTSAEMTYHQALASFAHSARDTIFQSQTSHTPIQVLGVMEAIGLEFDYIWVMGLHDGVWPPPPTPDRFIPALLQRQLSTPHSSAQRELNVVSKITKRLSGAAKKIIVSYAAMSGSDVLRPSPLLSDFIQVQQAELMQWSDQLWLDSIALSKQLESSCDDGLPVQPDEVIRGGSQIFKLQAACPFRAFVELRLDASAISDPTPGLDAAERGSLIHAALEYCWGIIGSQEKLLTLSDDELHSIVGHSIQRALEQLDQTQLLSGHFQQLEQKRLQQIIIEWMQIEKERPAFKVAAVEQKLSFEVNGLQINLKIDRIDDLEEGGQLVVDYKTGMVSPSQWFGDRPQEPQLPLYSVALPSAPNALAIAQLKTGELAYKGVAQQKGYLNGVRSYEQINGARESGSWQALMDDWKQTITVLADKFKQGRAQVDPLQYPATCQYCSLSQLCRINEMLENEAGDLHE